jgi:hypothetical protein
VFAGHGFISESDNYRRNFIEYSKFSGQCCHTIAIERLWIIIRWSYKITLNTWNNLIKKTGIKWRETHLDGDASSILVQFWLLNYIYTDQRAILLAACALWNYSINFSLYFNASFSTILVDIWRRCSLCL